jgi:hypothetical protein
LEVCPRAPEVSRMNAVTTRCALACTGRPRVLPVSRGADRFNGRSAAHSPPANRSAPPPRPARLAADQLGAAPRLAAPGARLRGQLLDAGAEHTIVPVQVAHVVLHPRLGRLRLGRRRHGVVSSAAAPALLPVHGVAGAVREARLHPRALGGRRGRGGGLDPRERRRRGAVGREGVPFLVLEEELNAAPVRCRLLRPGAFQLLRAAEPGGGRDNRSVTDICTRETKANRRRKRCDCQSH